MTGTAADQLRRLLDLVPRMADGESHPIRDLAAAIGTDEKTLVQDLGSLAARFDAPGGFIEGLSISLDADGCAEVYTQHFLRPMRLTVPELRALELGLAVLATERPPEELRAISGARERLQEAICAIPGDAEVSCDQVDATLAPIAEADRTTLAVLRQARHAHQKVRIVYRKPDLTVSDERIVCPYAVLVANGAWYLAGLCERSSGLRLFRVDRIEEASMIDATYEVPADFTPDQLVQDGRAFTASSVVETLVVRYSPRIARWIAERQGAPLAENGSLTLGYPLADTEWALRHVLQYGGDAEVLSPAKVRTALVVRLGEMSGRSATELG